MRYYEVCANGPTVVAVTDFSGRMQEKTVLR